MLKIRNLYLLVAVAGIIFPYYHFSLFYLEHGLDMQLFITKMYENEVSSFISWDLTLSSFAFFALVFIEGKKMAMKNLWVYIVFTFMVGLSLALPAFLYARQRKIDFKK